MSIQSLLSGLLGVDVGAMNDGHGLGCPCPIHRAQARERAARIVSDGFAPDTIGAAIEEHVSAAVGRAVLDKKT